MVTITNPMDECEIVPLQLSSKSVIVEKEIFEVKKGIILPTLDDVCSALQTFGTAHFEDANANNYDFYKTVAPQGSIKRKLVSQTRDNIDDILKKIIEYFRSELASKGNIRILDQYGQRGELIGTNFLKKEIACYEVGRQGYVLEIGGLDKIEETLAELIQKPRAVASINIDMSFSLVDEWWFNIDLRDIFQVISVDELKRFVGVIKKNHHFWNHLILTNNPINMGFFFSFVPYNLNFYTSKCIDQEKKAAQNHSFIDARETSLVGGSWILYDENNGRDIPITPINKKITLRLENKDYINNRTNSAITEEQISELRQNVKKMFEHLYV